MEIDGELDGWLRYLRARQATPSAATRDERGRAIKPGLSALQLSSDFNFRCHIAPYPCGQSRFRSLRLPSLECRISAQLIKSCPIGCKRFEAHREDKIADLSSDHGPISHFRAVLPPENSTFFRQFDYSCEIASGIRLYDELSNHCHRMLLSETKRKTVWFKLISVSQAPWSDVWHQPALIYVKQSGRHGPRT